MILSFDAAAFGYHGNLSELASLAESLGEERPAQGDQSGYDARMQDLADQFCAHLSCVDLVDAAEPLRTAFFNAPSDQQDQIVQAVRVRLDSRETMGKKCVDHLVLEGILALSDDPAHVAEVVALRGTVAVMLENVSVMPFLRHAREIAEYIPDTPDWGSPFSSHSIAALRNQFTTCLRTTLESPNAPAAHLQSFSDLSYKLTDEDAYEELSFQLSEKLARLEVLAPQVGLKF